MDADRGSSSRKDGDSTLYPVSGYTECSCNTWTADTGEEHQNASTTKAPPAPQHPSNDGGGSGPQLCGRGTLLSSRGTAVPRGWANSCCFSPSLSCQRLARYRCRCRKCIAKQKRKSPSFLAGGLKQMENKLLVKNRRYKEPNGNFRTEKPNNQNKNITG